MQPGAPEDLSENKHVGLIPEKPCDPGLHAMCWNLPWCPVAWVTDEWWSLLGGLEHQLSIPSLASYPEGVRETLKSQTTVGKNRSEAVSWDDCVDVHT
ncbi:hypothetical protein P7K49_013131 [Saguinus oedipus]|uniref:Uncharacterized protein n=1 Tax=Saguinus oedipus TaxID=9490 RepID=A0ABQ9VF11_SAGOE|nr:hypothetical protein P7K49_013131 [Saguinus oedipus]